MAPVDPRSSTEDLINNLEKWEDSLLDQLFEIRRIKRNLSNLGKEQEDSPDDTLVRMHNPILRESVHGREIRESIYEKAIIEIIQAAGPDVDMTFKPMADELRARGYKCHDQTIKRYLKKLQLDGRVINNHDGKGYRLSAE